MSNQRRHRLNTVTRSAIDARTATFDTLAVTVPPNLFAPDLVQVSQLQHLPAADPVTGAITLRENTTYYILNTLDLGSSWLYAPKPTVILGTSSEVSVIRRTAADAQAALVADSTIIVRHVTFETPSCPALDLDGSRDPAPPATGPAADWYGVNFNACQSAGTIADYDNFIAFSLGVFDSPRLTFEGTIGTIALDTCIFTNFTAGAGVPMLDFNGATVTRRVRIQFSSFVVTGARVAIETTGAFSVPTENFTINRCNFSGGGVYLSGPVDFDSVASDFVDNTGIDNTTSCGHMNMTANATATPIAVAGTFYPTLGVTDAHLLQKFTHTAGTALTQGYLKYAGANSGLYHIMCTFSATSGNNKVLQVALYIDNAQEAHSIVTLTTSGSGRAENGVTQEIVYLTGGATHRIDVRVTNTTDTTAVTVTDMNLICKRIN